MKEFKKGDIFIGYKYPNSTKFGCNFVSSMNQIIGIKGVVEIISGNTVFVYFEDIGNWWFPTNNPDDPNRRINNHVSSLQKL